MEGHAQTGPAAGVSGVTAESALTLQRLPSLWSVLLLVTPQQKQLVGESFKDEVTGDGDPSAHLGLDLFGLPASSSLVSQSME